MSKASRSAAALVAAWALACALSVIGARPAVAGPWAEADLVKASSADSAWVNVGIGGGGAFYQPAGSPHDPKLVFVSSDMGQLFRSTDAGKNWRMIDWRNCPHVKSPVFHPTNPDVIYAPAYEGDVLRVSKDKGVLWREVGGADPAWKGHNQLALAIGAKDASLLLLSTDKGLFRSADGGEKWQAVAAAPAGGPAPAVAGMIGLFIDPAAGSSGGAATADKAVCLGASKDGVFRSDDGGRTWAAKSTGLPHREIRGFAAGSDGKKTMIYCLLPSKKADGKIVGPGGPQAGGVWRSADRGETWESAMGDGIRLTAGGNMDQFVFLSMAQTHPDTVYVTNEGTDGPPPNHYTVYRTDDAGKTWQDCFYNDPRSGAAGCNAEVGWLTYDRSRGFGDKALSFGVNAGNPDQVFYTNYGEVFITNDGGKSWQQAFTRQAAGQGKPARGQRWESCGAEDTTTWRYVFDPHDKNRAYICYTDIGFARSEDRGASWLYDSKGRPSTNTTYDLAADPDVAGVFWGAFSDMHDIPTWRYAQGPGKTGGGVGKSTDHCKSWTLQNRGMPRAPCTAICLDPTSPKDARVLYAGSYGHGVFKSTDGGASWQDKSTGIDPPGNRQVYAVRRWKDGTLYCTVAARRKGAGAADNLTGGLFMSTDAAETWTRISSDAMYRCVEFDVDPTDKNIIYVAAMDGLGHKGGVYRTTDGGKTWDNPKIDYDKRICDYIEGMTVTIHPRLRNVIYFCAHSHGMFISKDSGKTWAAASPAQSPPHMKVQRFFWDPQDPKTVYTATFGGGIWKGPDPAGAD
jgi:photosystem II stability/assembly factor-like uncharacterized protein